MMKSWFDIDKPNARESIETWQKHLRELRTLDLDDLFARRAIEVAEFVIDEKHAGRMPTVVMADDERNAMRQQGSTLLICGQPSPFHGLEAWEEFRSSLDDLPCHDTLVIECKLNARQMIDELSMRGTRE